MDNINKMAEALNKASEANNLTVLSPKVKANLNEAIMRELEASQLYLHMAMWCDWKGYTGTAKYMREHVSEEREHMMKLYDYILDKDCLPITPQCKTHIEDFKDLKDILLKSLAHEKSVTAFYSKILKEAFSENDQMTFEFLQWFIEEQRDEEIGFKNFLDRLKIIGDDKRGQYFLDKEIGKTDE